MRDSYPGRFQAVGITVVIIALLGIGVYGRRWATFGERFPYVLGLFCTAVAVGWAVYERT